MMNPGTIASANWMNVISVLPYGKQASKDVYLPRLISGDRIDANAGSGAEAVADIFSRLRATNGATTLSANVHNAGVFLARGTIDPASPMGDRLGREGTCWRG